MNIDDFKKLKLSNTDIEEIEGLLQVTRENPSGEIYAKAQTVIGVLLLKNKYNQEAVNYWDSIKLADSAELYAKAKFNIGLEYKKKNLYQRAIGSFEEINQEYSKLYFSAASYQKGIILNYIYNNFEDALKLWNNIKIEDTKEGFAAAQYHIAKVYETKKDNYIKALEYLNKINKDDFLNFYNLAVLNIANIKAYKFNEYKEAIIVLSTLSEKTEDDIRIKADYLLGKLHFELEKYEEAEKYFQLSKKGIPYESLCFISICRLLMNEDTLSFGVKLTELFCYTRDIITLLKIEFDTKVNNLKSLERKLAHYTSTDICNKLMNDSLEETSPSSFRLNTISNVNDPSEGQVLRRYLSNYDQESPYNLKLDDNLHAFIGCFTFNHDSLNQFRLYGKTDDKEASGLSLVFSKRFFQTEEDLSYEEILSSQINNKGESFSTKDIDSETSRFKAIRCIYIDPKSGFVQIAHRSRITFYREFEEKDSPEQKWVEYKKIIDDKNDKLSKLLESLRKCYKNTKQNFREDYIENLELVEDILLPLNYIIKHSAFQEEQECRMIYITSLKDPKVQMSFGKFLYVNYEINVKDNLDKIYIAPAAGQFQPYLAKLLCDTEVKIELSNNPYRQT
ncbi:sel1 repeat family protein [Psychrobacter sp. NG25]|uniref:tetratricopeptide repeat protein n=1 Tax=Psychrobacter sp. NG25 TaxID=2782005 RepID=UPI0018846660|nr:DUF2971 domain-containing protein [Psychrobacter sp. NG25]MBF0657203.1 sel1 repeat family protein [Psychrobacter sp. NG25]